MHDGSISDLVVWRTVLPDDVIGAMRHGDQIILPYAISDTFSNFATIKIEDLMKAIAD